jgi:hypothetical protein
MKHTDFSDTRLVDVVRELAGEILTVSRERWLLEMNKISNISVFSPLLKP